MEGLFGGEGALTKKEWETLWKCYQIFGKHDWQTDVVLNGSKDSNGIKMLNDASKNLGRLADRLILTIAESKEGGVVSIVHARDCGIYAELKPEIPHSGICNCGYGLRRFRQGDASQMYSLELTAKLQEATRLK